MKFRAETTTSERQLALALAAAGRAVSLDELAVWRKGGLLPPMANRGLGAGRGKNYYWREGNILQHAQVACDAMRRHGRTDHALVTLFLSGFPVPLGQLRRAWQHRVKLRHSPVVRVARKKSIAGALPDMAADNLFLQAVLCMSAAVYTEDDHECVAIMGLMNRALSKLGLVRLGANDSALVEQLCRLLNIVSSVLDTSDLVRKASDDDLREAQRHLGIAMTFLSDCESLSQPLIETLERQLFLFLLTLLRSGQVGTVDRMMARLEGSSCQAAHPPSQNLALNSCHHLPRFHASIS